MFISFGYTELQNYNLSRNHILRKSLKVPKHCFIINDSIGCIISKLDPQPFHHPTIIPFNDTFDFYISLIFTESLITNKLRNIAYQMYKFNDKPYHVYTDGSLTNLGTDNIKMSFGWTFILDSNIPSSIDFNACIKNFPSSTRAEIFAILTALCVCPENSIINVYTDSQAAIDGFKSYVFHNIWMTERRFLKIRNYLIWSLI